MKPNLQIVADDDIDFDRYLAGPAEAARIKAAPNWRDDLISSFHDPAIATGCVLPWSKTHDAVRLRPGELSVWAGTNGHGKSLLLGQVMLSVAAQGERVCIASLEMRPVQTLHRMARQAVGVELPTVEWLHKFTEWADNRVWLYDQQGTVKADRMVAVLRYCAEDLGVTHFVIDSLMKCGLGTDAGYDAQKNFVDELSTHTRDTGMHVHLVAHSRKRQSENDVMGKFDIKGAGEITDMADNVFTVWRNKPKAEDQQQPVPSGKHDDEPDALLVCDKQRNGAWEGKIALWFDRRSQQFVPVREGHALDLLGWWDSPTVRANA